MATGIAVVAAAAFSSMAVADADLQCTSRFV